MEPSRDVVAGVEPGYERVVLTEAGPARSINQILSSFPLPDPGLGAQGRNESIVQLLSGVGGLSNYCADHIGSEGYYGSFQGLLNSFSANIPSGGYISSSYFNLNPVPEDEFGEPSRSQVNTSDLVRGDGIIGDPESPSRLHVDESGYASSGSSVYAVDSDDENYALDSAVSVDEELPDELDLTTSRGCDRVSEERCSGGSPEAEVCACIAGNPYLHVMTELPAEDTDGATWVKRHPSKRGQQRQDCRLSKGISPIEIALRNAPHRKTKYIFEPVLGITFDSENEAFDFYNMYSWEVGFGIKRDSLVTNNKGFKSRRDLRCLCSGTGDQAEHKTKKTGCNAMIRLLRSSDDGWYISRHIAEHNHPLTDTCGQTKEWKSHGKLDACAVDMVKYLRENNVSLTKVHCIMGSVLGDMHDIPFSKRSMRAICRRFAKDQMDDDVQKTLNVFRELRKSDPGFQFSVDLDENKKIKTLLWINGKSRDQFQYFGDVVTFDTTYCTNIYKMPFGLFVGVNNHFQTTIFGGVFMKDEKTSSFKWVFSEFLSLMGGKLPQTIFTDQCAAMAAALVDVWPGVTHLLCKWHIFKDAGPKLGPIYKKGSAFRKLFHKIINDMLTVEEFERAWSYMLNTFGLVENKYLSNIYDNREKWAKAYFRDSFCARMSSTQRSESANHMLKRFVPRNCSMNRFVIQFNKLLFDRNEAEDTAEYDTKIFKNVSKRAWPVEEHAMKLYTAAAYRLFRKEVDKSTDYLAKQKGDGNEYEVVHVKPHKKLPWGRDKLTVVFCEEDQSYKCECGLYNHFGMLCSHILRIFVQLGVYEIPTAHIHKRWTRSARDILPEQLKGYQKETLCLSSMTYRHSYLYVNAMDVVQDGNKDLGAFDIVSKDLKKIQRKLRDYFKAKEKIENDGFRERFSMVGAGNTSGSDTCVDSDAEGMTVQYNSFGAAGSSACMSDSELLSIKAPAFNRPVGRPRATRFKGALDYYGTKQKKTVNNLQDKRAGKNAVDANGKRKTRCGECRLLGHTATQCKKRVVDLNTELPEF